MKKIIYLYRILTFSAIVCGLNACNYEIVDIDKVPETMTLQASSTEIALDVDRLTEDIITFTWEAARSTSEDHVVTYTTKLDVMGNNFGSSTAIMHYEDDGVFSRSFTSEQLQNWANEKWKLPVNTPFTLEFRVTAQWEGGPTFEAPEVKTVTVRVQPIRTIVFDADKVFLDGSAVQESKVELGTTVENDNVYAQVLHFEPGELIIPIEYNGETNYISPTDNDGTLKDGETINVVVRENPVSWKIENTGEYRVVIDMQKATVTIYSPAKALQPAVVQWTLDGAMQTTIVNDLWEYGEPTGWNWRGGNWTQSIADPQIFVYSGPAINGRTKFGVHPTNQSYVYTGNNSSANTPVTHGTTYDVFSGYSANERNAYFSLPSGTNYIILDIRNKTMVATRR